MLGNQFDTGLTQESIKWLIEHGQLDSPLIVDCILGQSLMCDRAVKRAGFSFDRKEKLITIYLYMSRWSLLFRNKDKIRGRLFFLLSPLTEHYNLKCEFKIHKKLLS